MGGKHRYINGNWMIQTEKQSLIVRSCYYPYMYQIYIILFRFVYYKQNIKEIIISSLLSSYVTYCISPSNIPTGMQCIAISYGILSTIYFLFSTTISYQNIYANGRMPMFSFDATRPKVLFNFIWLKSQSVVIRCWFS